MVIRKLTCPYCGVGLKIADTLPAGKKIKCPKCATVLTVPQANAPARSGIAASPRSRKVAPPSPEDENHFDDEPSGDEEFEERRPRPKSKKKRQKQTNLV